jgi:hypothetical protein
MDNDRSSARSSGTADTGERESRDAWEDEGGSISRPARTDKRHTDNRHADRIVSGRIVQAGSSEPYKVVLTHEDGHTSEHPCATMREGEAYIRSVIPSHPKRDTSRDRAPGEA